MQAIDYVKIALIAFASVWIINKGLDKVGMSAYRA